MGYVKLADYTIAKGSKYIHAIFLQELRPDWVAAGARSLPRTGG